MASAFYDAGAVRRVANTLFLGWGYNFYRKENQLRADDQLVRAKAAWLLGQAAASVHAAEADHRREAFPPPRPWSGSAKRSWRSKAGCTPCRSPNRT